MADSEDIKSVKKFKRYENLGDPYRPKSEKVEIDRNEIINILTIMEGFKHKLQAELKKQA
jgi:hypothetical protein